MQKLAKTIILACLSITPLTLHSKVYYADSGDPEITCSLEKISPLNLARMLGTHEVYLFSTMDTRDETPTGQIAKEREFVDQIKNLVGIKIKIKNRTDKTITIEREEYINRLIDYIVEKEGILDLYPGTTMRKIGDVLTCLGGAPLIFVLIGIWAGWLDGNGRRTSIRTYHRHARTNVPVGGDSGLGIKLLYSAICAGSAALLIGMGMYDFLKARTLDKKKKKFENCTKIKSKGKRQIVPFSKATIKIKPNSEFQDILLVEKQYIQNLVSQATEKDLQLVYEAD